MQPTMVSGMSDRAIAVVATMLLEWMVRKGWLGQSDVVTLLPAIVLIPSLIWGFYVNTNRSLVQSAAAIPGTVVVTTPELAKATPNESNIVSSTAPKEAITAAVAGAKITPTPLKDK